MSSESEQKNDKKPTYKQLLKTIKEKKTPPKSTKIDNSCIRNELSCKITKI